MALSSNAISPSCAVGIYIALRFNPRFNAVIMQTWSKTRE